MSAQKTISVNDISLCNENSFVLIGGLNVLETKDLALKVAETFREITSRLQIPYIFKASFDKANRSSMDSFRGPGMEEGLRILEEVKQAFEISVLTDIHEPQQAEPAAEVADVLQLPAFLSRQTDLVSALANTKAVINIKKGQFLSPEEMENIIKKFEVSGNKKLVLCERGTSFGYNNLVVDMLGFKVMKKFGYPLVFDVTHSLQIPGGLGNSAAGRRESILELGLAGLSQKIAGLFLEAHPDPDKALCDGPSALRLDQLEPFLEQMLAVDELVKSFETLDTA
ncbi:MAG: 3-deoxy-8-phosphooctulonate synthase [SAR324 cluster bacterium]|jgi:2-dehydro-3-deoxyphosphooctonate aldolase (KDO 8-P synthase)|nr:3-deoxy-8-phosphooctulonate synthase [SAR324 cluster bacterium]MDP6521532.1 3-deoxy-8-phosphooctulonate synthase [SAR324 cluster bacterium]|tara:strand:- start:801 stop:1649 length:849 start_codon:yes stop_codon:yes gene_type:complete